MKAVLFKKLKAPLELTELPDPVPGPGEVVVRVLAAPVLPYLREVFDGTRDYPLLLPLVPGTGPIGLVEKTGPDATRLKSGQLVFCDPTVRSRDDVLAPDIMLQGLIAPTEGAKILQGHFRHGAFAEKMLLPMENAVHLEEMSAENAVRLACLATLLVPYGGLLAAGLQPGQTVLINGATGHFGSAGVALAIALGAERVVAVGRKREALDSLVQKFGPRVRPVVMTGEESQDVSALRAVCAQGVDCMLDMLSPIKTFTPVRTAMMGVRPNGTVVLMGGVQADISIPYGYIMRNGITIKGQYMYPRRAPRQLAGLIRSGLVDVSHFRIRTFPLDRFEDALADAAAHPGAFEQTVLVP
jgi:alcohol dehydrogenase